VSGDGEEEVNVDGEKGKDDVDEEEMKDEMRREDTNVTDRANRCTHTVQRPEIHHRTRSATRKGVIRPAWGVQKCCVKCVGSPHCCIIAESGPAGAARARSCYPVI